MAVPAKAGGAPYRSTPCVGAVDEAVAALAAGNRVGQLALRGQVAGDVPVVGRSLPEVIADAPLRIEHEHRLLESPPGRLYRAYLIGIARNDDEALNISLRRMKCKSPGQKAGALRRLGRAWRVDADILAKSGGDCP